MLADILQARPGRDRPGQDWGLSLSSSCDSRLGNRCRLPPSSLTPRLCCLPLRAAWRYWQNKRKKEGKNPQKTAAATVAALCCCCCCGCCLCQQLRKCELSSWAAIYGLLLLSCCCWSWQRSKCSIISPISWQSAHKLLEFSASGDFWWCTAAAIDRAAIFLGVSRTDTRTHHFNLWSHAAHNNRVLIKTQLILNWLKCALRRLRLRVTGLPVSLARFTPRSARLSTHYQAERNETKFQSFVSTWKLDLLRNATTIKIITRVFIWTKKQVTRALCECNRRVRYPLGSF